MKRNESGALAFATLLLCLPLAGSTVATSDPDGSDHSTAASASTDCVADLAPRTGDGQVDFADLLELLADWGFCFDTGGDEEAAPSIPPPCDSDFDASGYVDFEDLVHLLAAWGPC